MDMNAATGPTAGGHRICPASRAWMLDHPLRKLIHSPKRIVGPYVHPGDTVLDIGCASGFFTRPMAVMVGKEGCVIAADVQEEMLQIVREKAVQQGLESIIVTHKSGPDRIGLSEKVDFALAFYMVHEVPDAEAFLKEVASALKPRGKLLIVEPRMHVSPAAFEKTIEVARLAGLRTISEPKVRFSRSKLLSL